MVITIVLQLVLRLHLSARVDCVQGKNCAKVLRKLLARGLVHPVNLVSQLLPRGFEQGVVPRLAELTRVQAGVPKVVCVCREGIGILVPVMASILCGGQRSGLGSARAEPVARIDTRPTAQREARTLRQGRGRGSRTKHRGFLGPKVPFLLILEHVC